MKSREISLTLLEMNKPLTIHQHRKLWNGTILLLIIAYLLLGPLIWKSHDHLCFLGDFHKFKRGAPPLYFGNSHILHLKCHIQIEKLEEIYRIALENSACIGGGGSTWGKICKHIFGKNLTDNQAYLGSNGRPTMIQRTRNYFVWLVWALTMLIHFIIN